MIILARVSLNTALPRLTIQFVPEKQSAKQISAK
jgi:hypothetical protein